MKKGKGTPKNRCGAKIMQPQQPSLRASIPPQFSGQLPSPAYLVFTGLQGAGKGEAQASRAKPSPAGPCPHSPGPSPVGQEEIGRWGQVGKPELSPKARLAQGPAFPKHPPLPLAFLSQPGKVQYFFESNCKSLPSEEIKNSRLVPASPPGPSPPSPFLFSSLPAEGGEE